MKVFGFAIILTLGMLISPSLWADSNFLTNTKQAERLFSEKLYGDALPLYAQLIDFSIEEELKIPLKLRLVACYLEEKQPLVALDLLSPLNDSFFLPQSFYLMSLAYRQLEEPLRALEILRQSSLISICQHAKNLIALEQGCLLIQIGDFSRAQQVLEKIPQQNSDPISYGLAQLHLAKIHLITHQFEAAQQILSFLSQQLSQQHLLNVERIYLTGCLFQARNEDSEAAKCFEELLPKALSSNSDWSVQILKSLIACNLKQALMMEIPSERVQMLLSQTEMLLQQLLVQAPIESSYLLLTDFYLIKAKRLSDSESYEKAQQLLEKEELFPTQEGYHLALLKSAEAAPSFQERNSLYEQLISDPYLPKDISIKVLFFKGINHFEEGLKNQNQLITKTANSHFEQAAQTLGQTFQIGKDDDSVRSAAALKYQAIAYTYQPGREKAMQGWQIISQLISQPSLLSTFEYPQEIYCLAAWIALHLNQVDILEQSKALLQQRKAIAKTSSIWEERSLKLEGLICLRLNDYSQADRLFARFLQEYPHSSSIGEVWFWRAHAACNPSLKKEYFQQVYTQAPHSSYAPIAYFQFYSYQEYIQGHRKAIKHLKGMPLLFPTHPLLISAYYLIGLNQKKNLISEEGQILRRKDLTAAIDAFQEAESTFDNLFEKKLIPSDQLSYFFQVRMRAQLEKAEANLAIAQSSTGGKKQIYLEYAEGVFKQLIHKFTTLDSHAMESLIDPSSPYPKIWAEAELKLAETYEEKNCWKEAEAVLDESLEHYRNVKIAQSHGLMRVWVKKGKLAQRRVDHQGALRCFIEAENATHKYQGLSPNEKLNLWIQQSLCYKALNQLDNAMRLLSQVINDDVISPLRVKAMYLRAEIYECQGRPELALKQLEATAHKGGEWSQKAKERLEQIYGF